MKVAAHVQPQCHNFRLKFFGIMSLAAVPVVDFGNSVSEYFQARIQKKNKQKYKQLDRLKSADTKEHYKNEVCKYFISSFDLKNE